MSDDISVLKRLKVIAETNLEQAKLIENKYPRLPDKYRNIIAKITLQIAEVSAKASAPKKESVKDTPKKKKRKKK